MSDKFIKYTIRGIWIFMVIIAAWLGLLTGILLRGFEEIKSETIPVKVTKVENTAPTEPSEPEDIEYIETEATEVTEPTTETTETTEVTEPTTEATEPVKEIVEESTTKPSEPKTEPIKDKTEKKEEKTEPIEDKTDKKEEVTESKPKVDAASESSKPAASTETKKNTNMSELEMLACVIYQEAGGDAMCNDCRRRVGDVVLNRVNDSRFPNSIYKVLTAKNQYGKFSKTGIVWPKRAKNSGEKHAVERAWRIAEEILNGEHSELYGKGYVWQAGFKQGTDGFWCCGHFYGKG
jgi:spore germination cell wall hydrolase CwlJ-like protein